MAILIDDEDDKFNPHLQRALDAFQVEFDADMADCEDYKRKQRRLDAVFYRKLQTWLGYDTAEEQIEFVDEITSEDRGFSDILDEPASIESAFQALRGKLNARRTDEVRRVWDPWHTDLYRTIWFYGYEGSLTEPPCTGEYEKQYPFWFGPLDTSSNCLFQLNQKCRIRRMACDGQAGQDVQGAALSDEEAALPSR